MSTLVLLLIISALMTPAFGQTGDTDWFSKGMELYNQGKYEESLQAYNTMLEADPGDEEAWNNKGIDLGLLGKYDEALQAFNNATSINSSYAEAWYNMGVIFDFQGKYGSAINAYKKALEINPSYQKALVNKNRDSDIIMAPYLSCGCSNQLPLV